MKIRPLLPTAAIAASAGYMAADVALPHGILEPVALSGLWVKVVSAVLLGVVVPLLQQRLPWLKSLLDRLIQPPAEKSRLLEDVATIDRIEAEAPGCDRTRRACVELRAVRMERYRNATPARS